MSDTLRPTKEFDESGLYQIRLKGHLDGRWAGWFESLASVSAENGDTLISCPVPDQAALFGLLKKVRDLGIPLISVNRVETGRSETPDANS